MNSTDGKNSSNTLAMQMTRRRPQESDMLYFVFEGNVQAIETEVHAEGEASPRPMARVSRIHPQAVQYLFEGGSRLIAIEGEHESDLGVAV